LAGGTPVLALDMYEYSYQMDFGAKAGSYVDTFMDVICWNNVERPLVQAANAQGTGAATGQ
jgi:superoxide dismutase, Fe-Mn family